MTTLFGDGILGQRQVWISPELGESDEVTLVDRRCIGFEFKFETSKRNIVEGSLGCGICGKEKSREGVASPVTLNVTSKKVSSMVFLFPFFLFVKRKKTIKKEKKPF
ncbi:hypothetical protein Dimus_013453 [Dionaea muscipula]